MSSLASPALSCDGLTDVAAGSRTQIVNGSHYPRAEGFQKLEVDDAGVVIDEAGRVGRVAGALECLDEAEDLATEASGSDDEQGVRHALSSWWSVPSHPGVVPSGSAEMPSRFATERSVLQMIFRSPANVWLST
jgi:hypothetical protein